MPDLHLVLDEAISLGLDCHKDTGVREKHAGLALDHDGQRAFISSLLNSFVSGQQSIDSIKLLRKGEIGGFRPINGRNPSISIDSIAREILEGTTVAVNHFERCMPSVASRFRKIAEQSGTLCHMNVYWTPPTNSGSGRHSDDHDVGVLQIYGDKHWTYWKDQHETGIELRPSDFLYLKSGVEHDPRALDRGSIHITFGYLRAMAEDRIQRTLEFYDGAIDVPDSEIQTHLVPQVIDGIISPRTLAPILSSKMRVKTSQGYIRYETETGIAVLQMDEANRIFSTLPKPGHRLSVGIDVPMGEAFSVCMRLALAGGLEYGSPL